MVVFELTIPNCNTWNGAWSGAGKRYIKTKPDRSVPKDKIGRDFFYDFGDGWSANVNVSRMPAAEARKLEKKSAGFMGYGWMIDSIIKHDKIQG